MRREMINSASDKTCLRWRRLRGELRRAYFAHASDRAIRYDIRFDRLVEHVREAQAEEHLPILAIRYVDDLVHAIACIDGSDLAWRELFEHHEKALTRSCGLRLDPTDAILFVRRFFAELRHNNDADWDRRRPSLRCFAGTRSLRRWLRERSTRRLDAWAAWETGAETLSSVPVIRWSQVMKAHGVVEGKVTVPRPSWPVTGGVEAGMVGRTVLMDDAQTSPPAPPDEDLDPPPGAVPKVIGLAPAP